MRFLVDESTGKRFHRLLIHAGYDSVFVGDVLSGCDDEEILSKAESEKRILITDDKDFGELIFRLNKPASGVILFRGSKNPKERFDVFSEVLKKVSAESSFTTIKDDRFKTRKLDARQ